MSQYLLLNHIKIQNANCVAGLTWGFPAVSHFLGFTHALQRQLSADFDIALGGCGIVSHDFQLRVYKPSPRANFEFIQSKNPPVLAKHKAAFPSIIEEGKMNLTTSLIIEISKELVTTEETIKRFKQAVLMLCLKSRLAGGTILSVGQVELLSASTDEQLGKAAKKIKQLTMPGFVLMDRSEYLRRYFQQRQQTDENVEMLDAWLDYSAMKYQAQPKLKGNELEPSLATDSDWTLMPKPDKGWLVPIMTGYKAISQVYPAGDVSNTRDAETPACFVEAVHTIGEWKSMHRITEISDVIWTYQPEDEWYLCAQHKLDQTLKPAMPTEETEALDFETALANL